MTLIGARTLRLEGCQLDAEHAAVRWALESAAPVAAPLLSRRSPSAGTPGAAPLDALGLWWDGPFPALLLDAQFHCVDANAAFVQFIGRGHDQLIGGDTLQWHPSQDRPGVHALHETLRAATAHAGAPVTFEARYLDPLGRELHARVACRALLDAAGRAVHLCVLQDTTAEHMARERADRSARELDDWFDLSPVGMVLFDDRGLLIRTNPMFDALTGPLPVSLGDATHGLDELLGWTPPSPLAGLEPNAMPIQRQGWITPPDSPPRLLRAAVRCYRAAQGQRRYMGVVEDRSAEEERDLAQLQIGALIDTAGVGLATFQESSGWVRPGPGLRPLEPGVKAGASAALQSIRRDIVMPESLADFERLQAALRDAQRVEVRYAIRHPELGQRWLLTRVEPLTLASGNRTTSVVTLDITEQHLAQRRTEQLLHELSTILESTTAGIAYVRGNVLVRCNRRFEQMLGLRVGTMAGSTVKQLFGRHRKTERIAADAWQSLTDGSIYETEFDLLVKHGGSRATGS